MNLSLRWLSDYIDTGADIKKFCAEMTLSGSKVERYDTEGEDIKNVVVGKVLEQPVSIEGTHLVICKIDVGPAGNGEPLQIVTGAPNVNCGDLVPVAMDGATVIDRKEKKLVKIKKGKLRGVESNGMLCSLDELGLSLHDFPYAIADGIFILKDEESCEPIKIGQNIMEAIGFNDTSVEFEITSNRPDCLSVIGLAQEAHATFDKPVSIKEPSFRGNGEDINTMLKVKVQNTELCSRYIAGVVKNVKVGPSPRWMRERLRASGVRPINNFVDITNFVMLEYGQPMHAFDIRYINKAEINVRNAKQGEKITTLDGIERELSEKMLVIADADKPVAVAGVMGGEYSGIMDDTVDVVFESACFNGASVRTTAKALGMRTDASARFEKGLDPYNTLPALKRAFELVELLGCGEVVGSIIDADHSAKTPHGVEFNPDWINKFLGTAISEDTMVTILKKLGFKVENGMAYAPHNRIDIECKSDIAEEVARIYGYNNIPKTIIKGIAQASLSPEQIYERKIMNTMTALGANEITTYSFISPKYFDKIKLPVNSPLRKTVTITNPLGEDTSVMRTTVLPSMCEVLSRNYNNRNMSACLFELGNEYLPLDGEVLPNEPARLSVGMYGDDVDFYDIKGIITELLDIMGVKDYDITACTSTDDFAEADAFHKGRCAMITKDGVKLAILGELHPNVTENYDIDVKTYCAKVNIPEMMSVSTIEKAYKPLPKFPATTRDLALVCDDTTPVATLEKAIKIGVGAILEEITLFDVYKGKQIADGKKSVAFSISMRSHDGTLTDEQADAAMKRSLKELAKLGAEIRS